MKPDLSVIEKLGLDLPPVGLYYELFKPEDVPPLEPGLDKSLCEILRYAQEADRPFYFSKDYPENCVGKIMVGMDSFPPSAESGQIGPRLGVFDAARCNARLYYSVKRLKRGSVGHEPGCGGLAKAFRIAGVLRDQAALAGDEHDGGGGVQRLATLRVHEEGAGDELQRDQTRRGERRDAEAIGEDEVLTDDLRRLRVIVDAGAGDQAGRDFYLNIWHQRLMWWLIVKTAAANGEGEHPRPRRV